MKKRLLILCLFITEILCASTQEKLVAIIQNGNWPALAAETGDDTHLQVAAYFRECQRVVCTPLQLNVLMFYARFKEFAEIGEIRFTSKNGQFSQISLKRNVKPLHFIDGFVSYEIVDRIIRIGDGEILFKKGVIYQGCPLSNLFIFSGEWTFRIRPEDEEERLTLGNLIRSDIFVKEANVGIFLFGRPDLLSGLPEPRPADAPQDEEARMLYDIFQKKWGIGIPFFNEYWYFPFAPEFNVAMFHQKPGRSFFRYIFNSGSSPDTTLVLLPENKFYLNYNAVKGLKLTAQAGEELEKLQLYLFYNPQLQFLSGSSLLKFKTPASARTLSLDPGLLVKSYSRSEQHELQMFQREDAYFLMGQELDNFSFYYSGRILSSESGGELARYRINERVSVGKDSVYILDRDQNFYPNPGSQFFKSRVKISLPSSMHCLVSGSLSLQKRLGDRNVFVYESKGTKGVSLVCGNFKKLLTIPSQLPIQVFGTPKLRLEDFFAAGEIQHCFDFLLEKYGKLEIKELNLLLRRYPEYGGWSQQGFVVFNLLKSGVLFGGVAGGQRLLRDSPVIFTDVKRDTLVHELAHQWWGGVISWKSYQDQWLTEGLSQFSTLLYLQNVLSESQFRKVVAGAKKWVLRKSDSGPIIYGKRIANLSQDLDTYQSIVYDKSALIFLMLREIMGEEEMLARLRQILDEFKYQSLASARFIQNFSQGSPRLRKFFSGWIYTRRIPEVAYEVTTSGHDAEITFRQKDSDFVFPVGVRIETSEGKYMRTLVVEEKVQKFKLYESTPILSIKVDALVSPILLHD